MDEFARQRVDELFEHASALPVAERAGYLHQHCDDPAVRAQVEDRLSKHSVEGNLSEWLESWLDRNLGQDLSPQAPSLEAGQVIGRYRIERILGRGGMGQVYLAEDTELKRPVALKFLLADPVQSPEARRRFLHEARSASALNHPNVCTVFEVGEVAVAEDRRELAYIAMEYVEGKGLDAVIGAGSTPIRRVLEIAIQICDALDAAHSRGIVHRDIKPANICLNERGQVKVLDFGLAKRLSLSGDAKQLDSSDLRATEPGAVRGTPLYMSPEQALATTDLDHRSDIFSFGVVLYEMVTGQLPFRGSTSAEVLDKIVHAQPEAIARFNYESPAELDRITRKCLEKPPDERYQSTHELLIDLRKLLRDVTGSTAGAGGSHADVAQSVTLPAPSIEVLDPASVGESDVLISYAPVDDQPLLEGQSGWVSRLHRNLEVRVEQLSGEKVKIARLPGAPRSTEVEAEILERLPAAKAMVAVVSPPFVKTEACRTEVEHFWRLAERTGGQWVDDKARLLKVLKTAVSSQEFPSALSDIFSPLLGFDFFERESASGRVREFDEIFGAQPKQRFFERVYDLAHDLCHVLRALKQLEAQESAHPDADATRRWIYLAATTTDVQDEWDRIKRELVERGHVVLPDAPLPMMSGDAEDVVRDQLEKCSIAVHLLGRHYGVTPEDSSESLPALQLRLTAVCAQERELERLIWIPESGGAVDERQKEFIRRVEEDPDLHERAEIIEGNLNLLKQDLIRRLRPREEPKKLEAPATGVTPKLYLICSPRDEEAVESLEDYLFAQGLEVCLPAFDGSDAEAEALHRENLLTCDAVLVYYGTAPKAWVDIKLRELLKAAGYGREAPIGAQAVYVAPPDDRRKARFQSHQARIIRQEREFAPGAELEAFVGEAKARIS